jgi:anti-anti-sigma factor
VIEPADVQVDWIADTLVVRLRGEVDLSNAAAIKRSVEDAISNQETKVVIDLELVGYLDSAGIGLLFELWRQLDARQQRLVLLLPEGSPVRRSLEVSGWPSHIATVDNLDTAVRVEP